MLTTILTTFWLLAPADSDSAARLDDIVVTSTLRDVSVQEVPASLQVLDRQTLEDAAEQHFAEAIHLVPNLNWSSASNRPRFFQIRGIGERSQYEGAPNPSVGFLIDGIDFSGIGTVATLFDIEQVEVLRGPQGTRYGANALAGLIYLKTRDPSPEPEYRVELTAGDDGIWGAGFAAGGPVSEDLDYRFALHQYGADGFRNNPFLGRDDTNGRDELTARARFRWRPSDHWQVDLTGLWVDIDNGFDAFVPDNGLTVYSDKPGLDAQESLGLAVKAGFSGWSNAEFLSTTTLADSDILYSFDGDWGNPDYWGEFSPYDFTSQTDRERSTFSQELRLTSTPDGALFGGTTDWLVGFYGRRLEEDNGFLDFFNGAVFRDLTSDYAADHLALFGQLDWRLSDATTFRAGLRTERRLADYRDTAGLDLAPSETMVGGELSLRHQLDEGKTAYLTLARGFKAGGFNLGLNIPESRREFDAEYLWNLESGVKGRFFDGSVTGSLSVFYATRDDVQIETSFQVDPTDPLTFVFFTDNAASGTNYGLEAEASWQATESWRLFGSLGLLETELDDFLTPERDLEGRDQPHAPNYQFALGAEYRSVSGWFGRLDYTGSDEFYFSASHDRLSEPYELLNLKLGYETRDWAVYGWVRNATDEVYATRGFFFGLEPPDYPNREYIQRGDPRHFGVTAQLNWR